MTDSNNEELRKILDKMIAEHISISWQDLPCDSPINKFAQSYNYYHDEIDEGQTWAESVLTTLTHANDLSGIKFGTGDWYVFSQLLKSGYSVSPKLIGELLETILKEVSEIKADIPVLGIQKKSKGRPSDDQARRTYLGWLYYEIPRLKTEEGMSADQAYQHIGKKKHKSPDTIRRDHERHLKERAARQKELTLLKQQREKRNGEK